MRRIIEDWIQKLPLENIRDIVLRTGFETNTTSITAKWEKDEFQNIPDEVVEYLEEEPIGKLIAYDMNGKQKKSKNLRNKQFHTHNESEISIAMNGIMQVMESMRRYIDVQNDSLEICHETIREGMAFERESIQEKTDLELALAIQEHENEQGRVSTTDRLLGTVAEIVKSQTGNVDILSIANHLSDDELDNQIVKLMEDERIVSKVVERLSKG